MKNKKAIIFGGFGQDGFYLNQLLVENKIEVFLFGSENNVGDYIKVEEIIKTNKPDYIFHFAAISTTKHHALFSNHEAISTGTLNILESCKIHLPNCKIFISGSAMQFKNQSKPIDENTEFEASSPYSIARIQSVYAARYFRKYFGLKIYIGYFFNHDSPLRNEHHVNQKIVQTALRISKGSNEKLALGNIDVKKEFSHAKDIVEAVWILVNQNTISEAIIGSGLAYSIKDWLQYCFNELKLVVGEHLIIEQNFTPEYTILVSNPTLIKSIGWQPKISMQHLANEMMYASN